MSIKDTLAAIKALPYMTARYRSDWQEYRVTVTGVDAEKAERVAYYTNDAEDALETAKAMSRTEVEMRGDNRPR